MSDKWVEIYREGDQVIFATLERIMVDPAEAIKTIEDMENLELRDTSSKN